jgi:formimidoylglutamate deiminase
VFITIVRRDDGSLAASSSANPGEFMTVIHAAQALTSAGWQQNVRISLKQGYIDAIAAGVAPQTGDERHAVVIPGLPNLHSHAFQRGMAGLGETRGQSADSFWTWREVMYRFALSMMPEQQEAIAAQAYVEMLESGFTRVGEFHYLHHQQDGSSHGDIAEMAARIGSAAAETGINLTLLPVFYAHSSFGGAAPNDRQRRFINTRDSFARLTEVTTKLVAGLEGAVLGVAPHSLRAVTPDELAWLQTIAPDGPIHIHVAEQMQEVGDCVAWSGQRPVQWLLDHAPVDARWCLIHATHLDDGEVEHLARSGAVAGFCPVTEANLGDGIFRGREFLTAGGRFGIGTDSNVLIGAVDELRQLEYSQRLRDQSRNVLVEAGGSTGRALFDQALAGGAQALGAGASAIITGASADMLSLDMNNAGLTGKTTDQALDAWIFAAHRAVDCVWVRGRKQVAGGHHRRRDQIASRFRQAITQLMMQ